MSQGLCHKRHPLLCYEVLRKSFRKQILFWLFLNKCLKKSFIPHTVCQLKRRIIHSITIYSIKFPKAIFTATIRPRTARRPLPRCPCWDCPSIPFILSTRGSKLLWKVLLTCKLKTLNTNRAKDESCGAMRHLRFSSSSPRGGLPELLFYNTASANHFDHPPFVLLLQLYPRCNWSNIFAYATADTKE